MIILPLKNYNGLWTKTNYPSPQWGVTSTGSPYGRMQSIFNRVDTLGGLPAIVSIDYTNTMMYLFQFTENAIYPLRLINNVNGFVGNFFVTPTGNIIKFDEGQSRNLNWWNVQTYINYAGFPFPQFENGVALANGATYNTFSNVCFAQGGVSCSTYDGTPFVWPTVVDGKEAFITFPGSSCSGGNNWGQAKIAYAAKDHTQTFADGFGTGTQPALNEPYFNAFFQGYNSINGVWLGGNRVALLTGSAYANYGTILKIFEVQDFSQNSSSVAPCVGRVKVKLAPVQDIDLFQMIGSPAGASFINAHGIWSNNNGLVVASLGCQIGGQSYRYFVYINYPGPVVQPILCEIAGGAPSLRYLATLLPNGKPLFFSTYDGGAPGPGVYYHPAKLDLSFNFKMTLTPQPAPVYAGNIIENF